MSLTASLLNAIKRALSVSTPAVLVTVTQVKGSAPREVGAVMLVLPHSIQGTIGGGRLEYVATEKARSLTQQFEAKVVRERYPLGDSLGQCCGGSVELLFERVQPNWQQWVNAAIKSLDNDAAFQRRVDAHYTHLIKPHSMRLQLFGAGHVARALVRVLADAPMSIHWVDERAQEFPETIPNNVQCEVTDTPTVILKQATPGSAVLITTHRHDLDFELAGIAIELVDIAYSGMIGSTSKRARFERQWLHRHAADPDRHAALARLVCPIGGLELVGKEPEVIAIGVAYEIIKALQLRQAAKTA